MDLCRWACFTSHETRELPAGNSERVVRFPFSCWYPQHSYWERKHGTRVRVAGKPAKTWTEYSLNCCTNLHTGLFCFEGFHDFVSSRHYSLSMMNAEMYLEVCSCGLIEVLSGHWPGRKDRGKSRMKNITIVYDLSEIWKTHLQYNKCREFTIHQPSVLVEISVTVLNCMSWWSLPNLCILTTYNKADRLLCVCVFCAVHISRLTLCEYQCVDTTKYRSHSTTGSTWPPRICIIHPQRLVPSSVAVSVSRSG